MKTPTSPLPIGDRRSRGRHRLGAASGWRAKLVFGGKVLTGIIRDLSLSGMSLVVLRSLPYGAVVRVELVNRRQEYCYSRLLRVAHSHELPVGTWIIGGEFSTPLTMDQLAVLLR